MGVKILALGVLLAQAVAFQGPRIPRSNLPSSSLATPGHRLPETPKVRSGVRVQAAATGDGVTGEGWFGKTFPRTKKLLKVSPEVKKVVPLAIIFFCILFNYTILRDTKDVLVVTAPNSGAEIIPFLKTYVNLPGAIGFTVLYSKLTNKFSREQVFYMVLSSFLAFFALFALVIYPNQALLHPTAFAASLSAALPAGFAGPIGIIRNWTYAVFYTMAELW